MTFFDLIAVVIIITAIVLLLTGRISIGQFIALLLLAVLVAVLLAGVIPPLHSS